MNRSYSKIKHIQESNQRLEKRFLKEDSQIDIEKIKKNIPTIVNIILSVIPFTLIPRMIWFLSTGKYKDVLSQISQYKKEIEDRLKKQGIQMNLDQFISYFDEIKDEFKNVVMSTVKSTDKFKDTIKSSTESFIKPLLDKLGM